MDKDFVDEAERENTSGTYEEVMEISPTGYGYVPKKRKKTSTVWEIDKRTR
ncbi:hypothetical protein [Bacillus alkalicellulosilyticus]|uniref:hypothetical protein n=1 Tax=Alkalihalobacterium alkalicellulosilyticum TaxID=1912214 RepID=UPI00148349A0|nr:hypothetical protein [Bacillus alkalicellulosilyticus]